MKLVLLVLAAAAVSGAADAQTSSRVRLKDLDLRTVAGAAEALQRIEKAARDYCGTKGPQAQPYVDRVTLKCRRDLTERTVDQLHQPRVRQLHDLKLVPPDPPG